MLLEYWVSAGKKLRLKRPVLHLKIDKFQNYKISDRDRWALCLVWASKAYYRSLSCSFDIG